MTRKVKKYPKYTIQHHSRDTLHVIKTNNNLHFVHFVLQFVTKSVFNLRKYYQYADNLKCDPVALTVPS